MYPSKKTKSSSIPAKPHHDDQICPPRPRRCRTRKAPADEIPRSALSVTSPAAAVAAAYHGVRAAMPLDLLPSGRSPIVSGTAADSPRLPHARLLPLLIFQQQNARGYYAAWLCPTEQPSRQGAHGWRPCGFSRHVQTCFPSFPITPTSAFSSTCCSCCCCCRCCCRGVHTATQCDLKSTFRYAQQGCPRVYSHRGALAAAVFPASAGIPPSLRPATPSSPSESSDDGGTAALPAAPSVGGD